MTAQTAHVLQKLFSENSLDNISLDRLKQIVDEHPYFTLGHLLLAKKLQETHSPEYEAQSEKTSLYFNEPIWLQTLLNPVTKGELQIPERKTEEELLSGESVTQESRVEEQITDQPSFEQPVAEESIIEEPVLENPIVEEIIREEPPMQEIRETESTHQLADVVVEEVKDTQAVFEPYHTIDYFASQGIKISTEIKADDRLAHQLRSFTEWLKTMKRLPEAKVEEQLDEVTQQNIQEFASHSLDEKEIVTESMAEVLVKQNKEEEAVTIYEKLSLLNPSKRAYFAAKIEQLKGL